MTVHPNPRGAWIAAAAALVAGVSLAPIALAKKPPADAPEEAPAKKGAPAKPGAAAPEERVLEKKDGDYVLRLTLRPGNLRTNHVADLQLDINKNLEIPDPVTGDQMPMTGSKPVATIKSPEAAKGHRSSEPAKFLLWPGLNPGAFAFHFTPAEDGIYEISVTGTDPSFKPAEGADPQMFTVTYRIGAGTAAAQTEQSQVGTAVRRTARRPVGQGPGNENEKKLTKLMVEIGDRYLNLETQLTHPPAHGAQADAVAESHALEALFAKVKGLAPESMADGATEFDSLASGSASMVEAVATSAGGKDRSSAVAALGKVESASCNACHAKYRFFITDDVSEWPKFAQKAVKQ